ncbi:MULTISPECIES: biotin/lipoyl-containing protein [unclassified Corynebacterium]|uniref:biotin/lipoyl-containing protein n=1 Tax=unclassified Corynebacterium TaxID=2624378 RepID=UPI0030B05F8B
MKLKVTVNGIAYDVEVEVEEEQKRLSTIVMGGGATVTNTSEPATAKLSGVSSNSVVAPLAGSVSRILVEEGQQITSGEVLLILEAMKMETEITAPHDGTVGSINVEVGESVQGGQPLVSVE